MQVISMTTDLRVLLCQREWCCVNTKYYMFLLMGQESFALDLLTKLTIVKYYKLFKTRNDFDKVIIF